MSEYTKSYRRAIGQPYPIRAGSAHKVVCEVSLDRDGLDFLVHLLPLSDGFTEELRGIWQIVQERDEAEQQP